jgi:hypothetical protein
MRQVSLCYRLKSRFILAFFLKGKICLFFEGKTMPSKSKLAFLVSSAAILAGLTAALFPARTVLSKDSPAAGSPQGSVVTVAVVREAPAIDPPTRAIVPCPVIDPDASSFAGTGDGSAGVWIAK